MQNIENELEQIKNSLNLLQSDVSAGFRVITKRIGQLSDKLEERKVQNGKQDERLKTHEEDIKDLRDDLKELKKDYEKYMIENQESHTKILLLLEKQSGMYVKWLAGLTISLIPVLIAIIQLFMKGG